MLKTNPLKTNPELIILKARTLQASIRLHPGIIDYFKHNYKNHTSEMSQILHDYAMAKMTEDDIKRFILPHEDNQNRFIGG